ATAAGLPPFLTVEFSRPADSIEALAEAMSMFGGVQILCQPLVERAGGICRKPGSGCYYAERGGDDHLLVRVHFPSRHTYRRATTVSVQVREATKVVTAKGIRQNFVKFAQA
ncbi:unnamed protein product, partial [Prorocentrum cordatum]